MHDDDHNTDQPSTGHEAQGHDGHHVHVTPLWPMVGTFVALIVLTVLTVVTAKGLYFGNAINLTIALIIAGTKAVLVAAFFMHLLYDKAMNTVIVVSTMFAVVLFISLTLLDLGTRDMADAIEEGEIVPGGGVAISIDQDTGEKLFKGDYQPWHADNASKSVLTQARENYAAKKHHNADHSESPTEGDSYDEVEPAEPGGNGAGADAGEAAPAGEASTAAAP